MASRLGSIKRETIEHLRGCDKGREKKSRNEQLKEASERLQELMPELWRRAGLLSRLTRGSYEDLEDGFSVGFYPDDDDRIVLPVESFIKKSKKSQRDDTVRRGRRGRKRQVYKKTYSCFVRSRRGYA